ncbi:MAG: hypothetical protein WCO55_04135 [Candidatus Falkowbacteria bacterium]
MSIILKTRRGFFVPVIVGLIVTLMVLSSLIFFGVISRLSKYSNVSTCGLRARYAAEAGLNDVSNIKISLLAATSSCAVGMDINPSSFSCGLPGSQGTVVALDSSCVYTAQIMAMSTSSADILATGRCNLDECSGQASSIIQLTDKITD